jgi:hypothetical protein
MIRSELQSDLQRIFRTLGKTVVLVTHDLGEAAFFGDLIVLMRDGRIVQQGSAADLVERPADPFVTKFVSAQRGPLGAGGGRATGAAGGGAFVTGARADREGGDRDPPAGRRGRRERRDGRGAGARVGSKKFTESVVLGEIAAQAARPRAGSAVHRRELGGTTILWNALLSGEIDVYPEYTGTLAQEILSGEHLEGRGGAARGARAARRRHVPLARLQRHLRARDEGGGRAAARPAARSPDLASHPELALGFSNEFIDRADGWAGLRKAYGLSHANVRGLDHDLAYRGLDAGTIAVTDLYSTDAEIAFYKLRVSRTTAGSFRPTARCG